jgi:hypothetical protein
MIRRTPYTLPFHVKRTGRPWSSTTETVAP